MLCDVSITTATADWGLCDWRTPAAVWPFSVTESWGVAPGSGVCTVTATLFGHPLRLMCLM